jgi:hypothetical protein
MATLLKSFGTKSLSGGGILICNIYRNPNSPQTDKLLFPNLYKVYNLYILMDFYLILLRRVCTRSSQPDDCSQGCLCAYPPAQTARPLASSIRPLLPPDKKISSIFKHIRVYSSIFEYIQAYSSIFKHIRVYSSIFEYIQAYSSIFEVFLKNIQRICPIRPVCTQHNG